MREPAVNLGHLWKMLIRIAFSLFGAGVFYFAWMVAFLLTINLDNKVVETVLWLMAPVVTAASFAAGIIIPERVTGKSGTGFCRIWVWPLIGCAIGAGIVYWFGPMLIVFGMFAVGTASVVLREAVLFFRRKHA